MDHFLGVLELFMYLSMAGLALVGLGLLRVWYLIYKQQQLMAEKEARQNSKKEWWE